MRRHCSSDREKICKNFEITRTMCLNSERSEQFLVTECFSNFSCMFLNPNNSSNLNSNCSKSYDVRNLQEQVKKAFCYQKMFWPFTVANSRPSAFNFKSFSQSLDQFLLTVGQNNFGNKMPVPS